MRLFPTKESLPGVIWHDNNCKIRAVLRNCENPDERDYFNDCLLPVDVFHFKAKHKITDNYCNANCNPAQWPELQKGENSSEWRFNSSAAEQVNAWIGGYQAVVREMQVDRYNFFLDVMSGWRPSLNALVMHRDGFLEKILALLSAICRMQKLQLSI